jgi:hypothetical protein
LIAGVMLACTVAAIAAHADDADDMKQTALVAARVATNESSFRPQCVPWERRSLCVHDLAAIMQRTEMMAVRAGRSMRDELRLHSPRASGLCLELDVLGVPDAERPRRCRGFTPRGNTRWTAVLGLDGHAPPGWHAFTGGLPWSSRRARWVSNLRAAMRWLENPWYPCAEAPEVWAGHGDAIAPELVRVDCRRTSNTYLVRERGVRSIPANTAAGREQTPHGPGPWRGVRRGSTSVVVTR